MWKQTNKHVFKVKHSLVYFRNWNWHSHQFILIHINSFQMDLDVQYHQSWHISVCLSIWLPRREYKEQSDLFCELEGKLNLGCGRGNA